MRNIIGMWKNIFALSVKKSFQNIKTHVVRFGCAVEIVISFGSKVKILPAPGAGLRRDIKDLCSENTIQRQPNLNYHYITTKIATKKGANQLTGRAVGFTGKVIIGNIVLNIRLLIHRDMFKNTGWSWKRKLGDIYYQQKLYIT